MEGFDGSLAVVVSGIGLTITSNCFGAGLMFVTLGQTKDPETSLPWKMETDVQNAQGDKNERRNKPSAPKTLEIERIMFHSLARNNSFILRTLVIAVWGWYSSVPSPAP